MDRTPNTSPQRRSATPVQAGLKVPEGRKNRQGTLKHHDEQEEVRQNELTIFVVLWKIREGKCTEHTELEKHVHEGCGKPGLIVPFTESRSPSERHTHPPYLLQIPLLTHVAIVLWALDLQGHLCWSVSIASQSLWGPGS